MVILKIDMSSRRHGQLTYAYSFIIQVSIETVNHFFQNFQCISGGFCAEKERQKVCGERRKMQIFQRLSIGNSDRFEKGVRPGNL